MSEDQDEKRSIKILGNHNKYLIKKANKVKKREEKICVLPTISHHNQRNIINQIFMQEQCEKSELFIVEIQKKINGYKQQDKKKKIYDDEQIISTDETIEKLVISKLSCHYCRSNLFILYNNNLEKKQWTLDRINNDLCHSCDNTVICCLECNLKRRNTNKEKFEFTKKLKIIKNHD